MTGNPGSGPVPRQRTLARGVRAGNLPEAVAGQAPSRRQILSDVLEGRADAETAQRELEMRFEKRHLGLVIWSTPAAAGAPESDDPSELYELAWQVAGVIGNDSPLLIPRPDGELWMWVTLPCGSTFPPLRGVRARITPSDHLRVSAGTPYVGLEGFRRTHYGARAVAALARPVANQMPWLHEYLDAAVACLGSDVDSARMFVFSVLGGLARPGQRASILRETLRIYLSVGRSRSRAAQILEVAPNTVTYRVARASELIGDIGPGNSLKLRLALEIACAEDLRER
jgi:PucR C-terminal helix-turn-helix domain/GGDEF-like domain